ncbi:SMC-Scp complex subunit ScpB [Patescibacteria group bacterium]|nr:SMC-Scp complex subunit ScpB [Patescibacteria group bacterium]
MSDKLRSKLESILLVSSRPISIKKLAEIIGEKADKIIAELSDLSKDYQESAKGMRLLLNDKQAQLVSAPENSQLVKGYLNDELTGELSKPSLETLTIIAYRQPVTKAEMEQIRGINCSLILRNLMIRGLIEAEYNKEKLVTEYSVSMDFLKYLGLDAVSQLPDYEKLNSDENLQKILSQEIFQTQDVRDEVIKVKVNKE